MTRKQVERPNHRCHDEEAQSQTASPGRGRASTWRWSGRRRGERRASVGAFVWAWRSRPGTRQAGAEAGEPGGLDLQRNVDVSGSVVRGCVEEMV